MSMTLKASAKRSPTLGLGVEASTSLGVFGKSPTKNSFDPETVSLNCPHGLRFFVRKYGRG